MSKGVGGAGQALNKSKVSRDHVNNRMQSKRTNLRLFAPHIQVLALSFGEMVPCLLFGSSLEYRHNLFNCGGMQGRTRDHPETERERKTEGRWEGAEE